MAILIDLHMPISSEALQAFGLVQSRLPFPAGGGTHTVDGAEGCSTVISTLQKDAVSTLVAHKVAAGVVPPRVAESPNPLVELHRHVVSKHGRFLATDAHLIDAAADTAEDTFERRGGGMVCRIM